MPIRNPAPAQTLPWRSWYSLRRWRRRAKHQLAAEPLCAWCLASGRFVPATIADHVVSHRGDWNEFLLGDLQSLCVGCHNKKSSGAIERGYSDEIGLDGFPVDRNHPFNRPRAR